MTSQRELVEAYRHVFTRVPEGQVVLRDMMKASGLFQVTGVRSPEEVHHLEGSYDFPTSIIILANHVFDRVPSIVNHSREYQPPVARRSILFCHVNLFDLGHIPYYLR